MYVVFLILDPHIIVRLNYVYVIPSPSISCIRSERRIDHQVLLKKAELQTVRLPLRNPEYCEDLEGHDDQLKVEGSVQGTSFALRRGHSILTKDTLLIATLYL